MRKPTLFSTLEMTEVAKYLIDHDDELLRFFDRHRFQVIAGLTSISRPTWPPELLTTSKTQSASGDVAWHHWSSNHYRSRPMVSLPVRVRCR